MWIRKALQGMSRSNSQLFSIQYHKKISPETEKHALLSRKLRMSIDIYDIMQVVD
jgi:hypothetical protein